MTSRLLSHAELVAGLPEIERSPRERGSLEMIVRRPKSGEREVLEVAELDVEHGLVGDRWALAGDQLYVDFDLSLEHLPPGSRVAIGPAEIEVSPEPHTGCKLFRARYGEDAHKLVNSPDGRAWQLRGINAWIVKSGRVQVGDDVRALFD